MAVYDTRLALEPWEGATCVYNHAEICLLYTSDAADDSLRVDLGGRRIIKKHDKINKDAE